MPACTLLVTSSAFLPGRPETGELDSDSEPAITDLRLRCGTDNKEINEPTGRPFETVTSPEKEIRLSDEAEGAEGRRVEVAGREALEAFGLATPHLGGDVRVES